MTRSIVIGLFGWACLVAGLTRGQEVLREFSWVELKRADQLHNGEILPGDAPSRPEELKIDNPTGQPRVVTVLDLAKPGVQTLRYGIEGLVRHEGVEGKSYLEMWSYFADSGFYFSRTLGETGPMCHLEGTSAGRPFLLPFISDQKIGTPTRLVVNVVFAGPGTVYLSGMKLYQLDTDTRVGWWDVRAAQWIGVIGGTACGLLGGLIGLLGGLGKARRFVLTLTAGLTVLGAVSLVVGLIALALRQPFWVYFPLAWGGIILVGVCGALFPVFRRGYERIELRKMAAMDIQ